MISVWRTLEDIQASVDSDSETPDADFIIENWIPLSKKETEKAIKRYVPDATEKIKKLYLGDKSGQVFRCKHVTKDGLCGVWEDRPKVCSDYPFYSRTAANMKTVLFPGCGYEEERGKAKSEELIKSR